MEPIPVALRLHDQDHALEPGRDYVLGSDPDCDLRLGPSASDHHARLRIGAGTVEIEDLGSRSGTWRNGEQVERALLAMGDVLRLGDHEAIVVADTGDALLVPVPALRAAATERRLHAVRTAAASLRRTEGATFQELMAQELHRAPWLAVSLTLHALMLFLLWLSLPTNHPGGDARTTVGVDLAGEQPALEDGPPRPPEVQADPPDPAFDALRTVEEAARQETVEPGDLGLRTPPGLVPQNARVVRKPSMPVERRGAAAADDLRGVGSSGFQKTVGDLRKSGLEIVFVFDSTGSMTRTIVDTKTTIVQMLAVLQALVPDARIGLVTYRDRGPREQYIVRQLPLGLDFWRASNFVQFVVAEGGGDRPEEVRAGLRAAFQQEWSPHARRVVVLAGDAPPHDDDWQKLLSEVHAFANDGRSFVHTLVTSPDTAGQDTQQRFAEIAKAGKGTCTDLQAHDRVLQRVLTLAFGREFDQDLVTVTAAVENDQKRIDVQALDLARRGGRALARELQKNPVPVALLNALVRGKHRTVVLELVDQLGEPTTPNHSRQAIASALQRILELSVPPIDPVAAEGPSKRELERLRRAAAQLPD